MALEETETWLAGGGVVTGNLKSRHFLGLPRGHWEVTAAEGHPEPDVSLSHSLSHAPLQGLLLGMVSTGNQGLGEGEGAGGSARAGRMWSEHLIPASHLFSWAV